MQPVLYLGADSAYIFLKEKKREGKERKGETSRGSNRSEANGTHGVAWHATPRRTSVVVERARRDVDLVRLVLHSIRSSFSSQPVVPKVREARDDLGRAWRVTGPPSQERTLCHQILHSLFFKLKYYSFIFTLIREHLLCLLQTILTLHYSFFCVFKAVSLCLGNPWKT